MNTKVLLVVESPNKAKKIRGYFPEFDVLATVGHFKDLPQDSMGVEAPDHKPEWVVMDGKQQVITKLRASAKTADIIYIATDPDREGEAIAAHVANTLGKTFASKVSRITYSEVSKSAINQAIRAKRNIDWSLVRAQEARRVVDRYVGYLVSPELTNKFKPTGNSKFLSAGRVQSVAVKLVTERHEEIQQFVSVEHYGVIATVIKSGISFQAVWKPVLDTGALLTDKNLANSVVARTSSLVVSKIESKPKKVSPPKPLMTSSFVRLMGAALKLTTKQAMDAAQKLFEQGLITYHRTDSPTMSEVFVEDLREFASRNKLPLPASPRTYEAGANAQQGHECLRVTDINLINIRAAGVEDPLLTSVYKLVWKITLESQLVDGEDTETTISFENAVKDKFISRAKVARVDGWRSAAKQFGYSVEAQTATTGLDKVKTDENESNDEKIFTSLPELVISESLKPTELKCVTKHTAPPKAYTEITLVEKLDKLGIGRPSTYAQTLERIITMEYVTRHSKSLQLEPTPRGIAIVHALKDQFKFMDYGYTAELESSFDKIAHRKAEYLHVVHEAYESLQTEMTEFKKTPLPAKSLGNAKSIPITETSKKTSPPKNKGTGFTKSEPNKTQASQKCSAGDKCQSCNKGTLIVRTFTSGDNAGKSYFGCSQFPACRYFKWKQ